MGLFQMQHVGRKALIPQRVAVEQGAFAGLSQIAARANRTQRFILNRSQKSA